MNEADANLFVSDSAPAGEGQVWGGEKEPRPMHDSKAAEDLFPPRNTSEPQRATVTVTGIYTTDPESAKTPDAHLFATRLLDRLKTEGLRHVLSCEEYTRALQVIEEELEAYMHDTKAAEDLFDEGTVDYPVSLKVRVSELERQNAALRAELDDGSAFVGPHPVPASILAKKVTVREFIAALQDELNAAHDVLRSLASFVGNGGYNADTVDAKVFEGKIRDGIDSQARMLAEARAEVERLKKRLGAVNGRDAIDVMEEKIIALERENIAVRRLETAEVERLEASVKAWKAEAAAWKERSKS